MKRIGWTALLLGVVMFVAGCPWGGANQPAEPEYVVPEGVDGQKVSGALGRALLKGVNEELAPSEAPPADP